MRALVQKDLGQIELMDIPDPVYANAGHVVLRVEMVALNHLDVYAFSGMQFAKRALPSLVGCECVGEIVQLGAGVTTWSVGQRVVVYPGQVCHACDRCLADRHNHCRNVSQIRGFNIDGFAAQFVTVDAHNLIAVPDGLDSQYAVCAPIGFGTPEHMLFDNARVLEGEAVLVHSAGSGIGTAAIKLCKDVGARVIATVSSDDKIDLGLELGADEVINRSTVNFSKACKKFTGGQGIDVVFEHIGKDTFQRSLLCLGRAGRLVTCGATSGIQSDINLLHLFNMQLRIFGSFGCRKQNITDVMAKMRRGLMPVIDSTFEIADWQHAIQKLRSRNVFGKILVRI